MNGDEMADRLEWLADGIRRGYIDADPVAAVAYAVRVLDAPVRIEQITNATQGGRKAPTTATPSLDPYISTPPNDNATAAVKMAHVNADFPPVKLKLKEIPVDSLNTVRALWSNYGLKIALVNDTVETAIEKAKRGDTILIKYIGGISHRKQWVLADRLTASVKLNYVDGGISKNTGGD